MQKFKKKENSQVTEKVYAIVAGTVCLSPKQESLDGREIQIQAP